MNVQADLCVVCVWMNMSEGTFYIMLHCNYLLDAFWFMLIGCFHDCCHPYEECSK